MTNEKISLGAQSEKGIQKISYSHLSGVFLTLIFQLQAIEMR
jgi:hypothetical protein